LSRFGGDPVIAVAGCGGVMFWERYTRARITRRRALTGGAALAAGAAALAVGCDSGSEPESGSDQPRTASPDKPDVLNPAMPPRHGGTLVTANAADFGTWDPHLGVAVASAYYPRIYNLLVNQSASKPEFIIHDLAESFEVPDETTFIFKIRPGVKVAPNDLGVPERDVDGEDVRVTLERIAGEGTATNNAFVRQHVKSVTVQGDTVRIETPEPYAWFLNRIGLFFNAIAPRELLTGDTSKIARAGAGGGPYKIRSVTEGEVARLERNPNYYRRDETNNNAQLPYVDNMEIRVIFDKATQRTAFQSGQVHNYMTGSSTDANSLDGAVVARDPAFTFIAFTMNPERGPFADPRIRRAISRAINRQEYVDLVYGGDARANGLVHWPLGSYALSEEELATLQPYDVEDAKRLVSEVGGIRIKMMYPAAAVVLEHSDHLPIFLKQMERAGIDVQQDPQDFSTWVTNIKDLNYDCTLNLNQMYETPEIPLAIHTSSGPFGDGTYLRGLGDPEIEAAVQAVSRELGTDRRIELVREAQRVIYGKDPISLPLVTPINNIAWRKVLKNIPTGIGSSSFLVNTFWLDS
jgi:peptide/nickel transport system substrate-binding protein